MKIKDLISRLSEFNEESEVKIMNQICGNGEQRLGDIRYLAQLGLNLETMQTDVVLSSFELMEISSELDINEINKLIKKN